MEYEYKNIGGKLIRIRRNSDSSVDSLAPTDIAHPSQAYYEEDFVFSFDSYRICPLTHNMMQGNALYFQNLVLLGQRLKRRRWKIYEGHFREVCSEHRRDNGDDNEDCLDLYSNSKDGKYGSKRKHLYTEVIAFLLKFETERDADVRKGMKESFILLWDVMPFPYVRIQEMRKMLEYEWANKCTFAFKLLLERAVDTYRNEFSDISVGDVEPRKLQHLCKCKIRQRLWRDRPKGRQEQLNVNSLLFNDSPLPQLLVSYLRVVDRRIDSLQESGLGSPVSPGIKTSLENPPGSADPPNDPPGSADPPNDPPGSTNFPNDPPVSASSPNESSGSARCLDDSSSSSTSYSDCYYGNYYDNCSD